MIWNSQENFNLCSRLDRNSLLTGKGRCAGRREGGQRFFPSSGLVTSPIQQWLISFPDNGNDGFRFMTTGFSISACWIIICQNWLSFRLLLLDSGAENTGLRRSIPPFVNRPFTKNRIAVRNKFNGKKSVLFSEEDCFRLHRRLKSIGYFQKSGKQAYSWRAARLVPSWTSVTSSISKIEAFER